MRHRPGSTCLRLSLRLALAGFVTTLAWSSPIQSDGTGKTPQSREQASLVEEQELLARKLVRVVESMNRLANRFEAEGRVHGAELLRDGLEHIALRHENADGLTLAERMSGSHEKLSIGQSMQSIETQQQVIAELETLISILMDRPDLDELESEIEKIQRQKLELQSIADSEAQLETDTEALRESSSNEAQESLEAGIAKALEEQRELLADNERISRQSGALDLEQIEKELSALLRDQHTDVEVLKEWDPAGAVPLQELLPHLELARRSELRTERLQEAAESLRDASEAQQDISTQARSFEEKAESAQRAARASGEESASRVAEALEKAAQELRQAGEDEEKKAQAFEELSELARGLEQQAETERRAAEDSRRAAREELKSLESSSSAATRELARELGERLEQADSAQSDEAREATELAHRELRAALEQTKFLGQALASSQEQNAERAEKLRGALEHLPQDLGSQGSEAQEALEEARDAMRGASESAQQEEPVASQEAASRAEKALERAQAALESGRQQNARSSGSEAAQENAQLAQAQEELAREVQGMTGLSDEASLDDVSKSEVREALQEAGEAMQQASEEMQQGKNASAAQSQRQASEALQRAAKEAREGVVPQTEEDLARAQELAEEQARIQQELYEFRLQYEEQGDEDSPPLNSLSRATSSQSQAQQSLEQGELDSAQQQEQQAQQALEQAMAELEQKEEQYQKLRDEELLFQIAEEVASILEAQQAAALETVEVDRGRKEGKSATRGQKLRLRKISRNESALAKRSAEIREAIAAEGSLVFAELIERIEHDLNSVARSLGPEGGYQSGDRVQALQADVIHYLNWLVQALEEEQERREEEEQQGQQPSSSEPPPEAQGENRLVPDIAELKLLARMEVDVLDSIEELLVLYPELKEVEDIDPLLLEEVQRLAHRHERSTELFQQFRERLGIKSPELKLNTDEDAGGSEAGEDEQGKDTEERSP